MGQYEQMPWVVRRVFEYSSSVTFLVSIFFLRFNNNKVCREFLEIMSHLNILQKVYRSYQKVVAALISMQSQLVTCRFYVELKLLSHHILMQPQCINFTIYKNIYNRHLLTRFARNS